MSEYYDTLLAAIPALLTAGLVLSFHPAVAVYQGLLVGSIAATLVLFEAIYRNPPVEVSPRTVGASVVVSAGWAGSALVFLL